MSSKSIIVLGVIATFSILFVVALSMGYGSNNYLFQDGSKPLIANWDVGGWNISNIDEVDGKDVGGTHVRIHQMDTSHLGKNPTNPPVVVVQDNVILYEFTVDTDEIHASLPIPHDYASGDLNFSVVWTNDGGVDDNGLNVEWQLSYQTATEGDAVNGSHANSPKTIVDTYTSDSGWIEHHSGVMTIASADFSGKVCIIVKISAITTADPLSCEPHLMGVCLTYIAHNVDDS